jgi:hypothetical protein
MDSKRAEELSKAGLTGDDRAVMEKKSITPADIKGAIIDDPMGSKGAPGGNLLKTIVVIVFSLLLLAGGIFMAVFSSITVFGIIIGIVMIIAAIAIPFYALGR